MRTIIDDPEALRAALYESMQPDVREAVGRIARAAAPSRVYAVGGAVRDVMLRSDVIDLDLAVDGDAPAIVRAALPDARLTTHVRFGTASVAVGRTRIDVATTRRETYTRPGALPRVQPAGIDDDLRRRDFSVNAMALTLEGPPQLLDPCGGVRDVQARLVRALHDGSFSDDATRVFRAFRYAARLHFSIEPHTEHLLRAGTAYVRTIGGERLRRELELMIGEPAAGAALSTSASSGALSAVHAALRWDEARTNALSAAAAFRASRIECGFALMAADAGSDAVDAIVARLRLKRREAAAVGGIAALARAAEMLARRDATPSGVVVLLDRFPLSSVAAYCGIAADGVVRDLTLRYLEEWRHERPVLNGKDLQDMGVPAGPQVQRGLQLIRAARLDGWAHDRGDEQAIVMRFAKSIRDSSSMNARLETQFDGA
jgi:tRNA nucleotidyltransferase (CCA-adding enzyme)